MKKKLLLIPLALLLAIGLVAIGCPAAEEEVTPPPEEEVTPPPEEEVTPPEVIELIVNDHNPPPTGPAQAYDYWAEQVEAESGGRLSIEVIHGGALFTGQEVYRAVETGACAGGHYVVDREDGFLLNLIMTLPFMGWSEQHVEAKYQTLLDEFPEMAAEWEGVTITSFMMMPPTHVHTVDIGRVIKTPDDIDGVKIFCAEAILSEIMNAVGATAVEHGIMDMTPDVQTGVVDGVINHFPVLNVFGTLELLPYHTVFGNGGINITPMFDLMNTDVLNSLPPDLRDIMLNSSHYWFDKFNELDAADIAGAAAFCEENNHTMTELTPAEIEVWYNMVKDTIHADWIAECEAAGLPGQAVYDRALELAQE